MVNTDNLDEKLSGDGTFDSSFDPNRNNIFQVWNLDSNKPTQFLNKCLTSSDHPSFSDGKEYCRRLKDEGKTLDFVRLCNSLAYNLTLNLERGYDRLKVPTKNKDYIMSMLCGDQHISKILGGQIDQSIRYLDDAINGLKELRSKSSPSENMKYYRNLSSETFNSIEALFDLMNFYSLLSMSRDTSLRTRTDLGEENLNQTPSKLIDLVESASYLPYELPSFQDNTSSSYGDYQDMMCIVEFYLECAKCTFDLQRKISKSNLDLRIEGNVSNINKLKERLHEVIKNNLIQSDNAYTKFYKAVNNSLTDIISGKTSPSFEIKELKLINLTLKRMTKSTDLIYEYDSELESINLFYPRLLSELSSPRLAKFLQISTLSQLAYMLSGSKKVDDLNESFCCINEALKLSEQYVNIFQEDAIQTNDYHRNIYKTHSNSIFNMGVYSIIIGRKLNVLSQPKFMRWIYRCAYAWKASPEREWEKLAKTKNLSVYRRSNLLGKNKHKN